jgi:hypothetical protein
MFGDQRPPRPPVAPYYPSIKAIARRCLRIDRGPILLRSKTI